MDLYDSSRPIFLNSRLNYDRSIRIQDFSRTLSIFTPPSSLPSPFRYAEPPFSQITSSRNLRTPRHATYSRSEGEERKKKERRFGMKRLSRRRMYARRANRPRARLERSREGRGGFRSLTVHREALGRWELLATRITCTYARARTHARTYARAAAGPLPFPFDPPLGARRLVSRYVRPFSSHPTRGWRRWEGGGKGHNAPQMHTRIRVSPWDWSPRGDERQCRSAARFAMAATDAATRNSRKSDSSTDFRFVASLTSGQTKIVRFPPACHSFPPPPLWSPLIPELSGAILLGQLRLDCSSLNLENRLFPSFRIIQFVRTSKRRIFKSARMCTSSYSRS